MIKTNYHTHCTYCDGDTSIEDIIREAINRKFDVLGFSSHSMYPFAASWTMSPALHDNYCNEINALKDKYRNEIEILLGFEADYIAGVCTPDLAAKSLFKPDYTIGSVHFVPGNKGYFEADGNFQETREKIKTVFNGDTKKAVQEYFSCQREMLSNASFTFLGHCDLIRKQNSPKCKTGPLFDENDSWYKDEIKATADAIAKNGCVVEINTGSLARGYFDSPYPSPYFLQLLHERNVPVTINSDSHNPSTLDYWFEEALLYIKKAGYKEIAFLSSGSMKFQTV